MYMKKIYFNYKYVDCTIPLSWFQIEVFDPIGANFFCRLRTWLQEITGMENDLIIIN